MNSKKYFLVLLAVVIFLCVPLPYQSAQAAKKDALIAPVVVTINSEPIYEAELLYFLIGRNGQDILAELIENAILAQKADFYSVTIDPDKPRKEMMKMYGEAKFDELAESFDVDKILRAVEREHLSEKVYDAMIESLISEKGIEITRFSGESNYKPIPSVFCEVCDYVIRWLKFNCDATIRAMKFFI